MLPHNTRDDRARIHVVQEQHEVWIHRCSGDIEFVKSYDNKISAVAFIMGYNGQIGSIERI
jgi:hypothetical protein